MDTFTRLLEGFNLDSRSLGGLKRENCQLTNLQVFQILLPLPFFAVKGFSHYEGSALCRMFGGKKRCSIFIFVAKQHQLAECIIPHNQLAADERDCTP